MVDVVERAPLNTILSKAEYKRHLRELVRAIVLRFGPMTVGAVHERVNGIIVRDGIIGAAERVLGGHYD